MTPNIEISTIVGCRMMCDYCPQKVHVKNYAKDNDEFVLSLTNFKTILAKIPKHVEIVFAGMAEPWLNPDCTEMVEHAVNEGYQVGVYSTGEGMTLTDAILISDLPLMYFTLHLPDVGWRMHLKITDTYLEVIRTLKKRKPNYMVIGEVHPEVAKITGPVVDGSGSLLSRAGNIKSLAIPRKKGVLHCPACGPKLDHNILMPNGDILLCCMIYDLKHVLGNLLRQDYESLFTGHEYQRVMKGLADESIDIACRNCEVAEN